MSPIGNGQEHKSTNGRDFIGVAIPQVPVTEERQPFMQTDDHGYLQQAGKLRFIQIETKF